MRKRKNIRLGMWRDVWDWWKIRIGLNFIWYFKHYNLINNYYLFLIDKLCSNVKKNIE